MIKVSTGSIVNSNATFIVNEVNCKGVMNGKIFNTIKKQFPHVFKKYSDFCKSFLKSKDALGSVLYIPMNVSELMLSGDIKSPVFVNMFVKNSYLHTNQQIYYDNLVKCIESLKSVIINDRRFNNATIAFALSNKYLKSNNTISSIILLLKLYFSDDIEITIYTK